MYVKICGIREPEHAALAARLGARAIGVVMSPGSPRDASPETASLVIQAARAASPTVETVLVVDQMPAEQAARMARDLGFDVLQLHGGYERSDFELAETIHPRVWRATSLARDREVHAGDHGEERLLIDGAVPGSGETWDLSTADPERLGSNWLLAGGLSPDNVGAAVRAAHPAGVDVSSGVESIRGEKNPELIERFIVAALAAAAAAAPIRDDGATGRIEAH